MDPLLLGLRLGRAPLQAQKDFILQVAWPILEDLPEGTPLHVLESQASSLSRIYLACASEVRGVIEKRVLEEGRGIFLSLPFLLYALSPHIPGARGKLIHLGTLEFDDEEIAIVISQALFLLRLNYPTSSFVIPPGSGDGSIGGVQRLRAIHDLGGGCHLDGIQPNVPVKIPSPFRSLLVHLDGQSLRETLGPSKQQLYLWAKGIAIHAWSQSRGTQMGCPLISSSQQHAKVGRQFAAALGRRIQRARTKIHIGEALCAIILGVFDGIKEVQPKSIQWFLPTIPLLLSQRTSWGAPLAVYLTASLLGIPDALPKGAEERLFGDALGEWASKSGGWENDPAITSFLLSAFAHHNPDKEDASPEIKVSRAWVNTLITSDQMKMRLQEIKEETAITQAEPRAPPTPPAPADPSPPPVPPSSLPPQPTPPIDPPPPPRMRIIPPEVALATPPAPWKPPSRQRLPLPSSLLDSIGGGLGGRPPLPSIPTPQHLDYVTYPLAGTTRPQRLPMPGDVLAPLPLFGQSALSSVRPSVPPARFNEDPRWAIPLPEPLLEDHPAFSPAPPIDPSSIRDRCLPRLVHPFSILDIPFPKVGPPQVDFLDELDRIYPRWEPSLSNLGNMNHGVISKPPSLSLPSSADPGDVPILEEYHEEVGEYERDAIQLSPPPHPDHTSYSITRSGGKAWISPDGAEYTGEESVLSSIQGDLAPDPSPRVVEVEDEVPPQGRPEEEGEKLWGGWWYGGPGDERARRALPPPERSGARTAIGKDGKLLRGILRASRGRESYISFPLAGARRDGSPAQEHGSVQNDWRAHHSPPPMRPMMDGGGMDRLARVAHGAPLPYAFLASLQPLLNSLPFSKEATASHENVPGLGPSRHLHPVLKEVLLRDPELLWSLCGDIFNPSEPLNLDHGPLPMDNAQYAQILDRLHPYSRRLKGAEMALLRQGHFLSAREARERIVDEMRSLEPC